MDRNPASKYHQILLRVALRKESVDRNAFWTAQSRPLKRVALRKESVDRNVNAVVSYNIIVTSLSARRAWIEIALLVYLALIR